MTNSELAWHSQYWMLLGAARVRAADWTGGQNAIDRAFQLGAKGDPWDRLFLAIAFWHRGEASEAHHFYHRAAAAIDAQPQPRDPALDRLRDEAAALIRARTPQPGTTGSARS